MIVIRGAKRELVSASDGVSMAAMFNEQQRKSRRSSHCSKESSHRKAFDSDAGPEQVLDCEDSSIPAAAVNGWLGISV